MDIVSTVVDTIATKKEQNANFEDFSHAPDAFLRLQAFGVDDVRVPLGPAVNDGLFLVALPLLERRRLKAVR